MSESPPTESSESGNDSSLGHLHTGLSRPLGPQRVRRAQAAQLFDLRRLESQQRLRPSHVAKALRLYLKHPSFRDGELDTEIDRVVSRYTAVGTDAEDATDNLHQLGVRSSSLVDVMAALGYEAEAMAQQFDARLQHNVTKDAAAVHAHPSSGLTTQQVQRGLHLHSSEGLAQD